ALPGALDDRRSLEARQLVAALVEELSEDRRLLADRQPVVLRTIERQGEEGLAGAAPELAAGEADAARGGRAARREVVDGATERAVRQLGDALPFRQPVPDLAALLLQLGDRLRRPLGAGALRAQRHG